MANLMPQYQFRMKETIEKNVTSFNSDKKNCPIIAFQFVSLDSKDKNKLMWWSYDHKDISEKYDRIVHEFIGEKELERTLINCEFDSAPYWTKFLGEEGKIITCFDKSGFKFKVEPDPVGEKKTDWYNHTNSKPNNEVLDDWGNLLKKNFGKGTAMWVSIPHNDVNERKIYSSVFCLLNDKATHLELIGAYFYIRNFITNYLIDLYKAPIEKEVEKFKIDEQKRIRRATKEDPDVFISENIQKKLDEIQFAIRQNIAILLYGETGTGKEVIAKKIQLMSLRKGCQYLSINCAGFSEDGSMTDSELFGHEEGAFTGAIKSRIGHFEECAGGTIFLDEIQQMPLSMQKKIKRVVETGEILKVGSSKPKNVDVRLIFATNRNLVDLVRKGEFLDDLFYRINIITLTIPPLRERKDEIKNLTEVFLKKFNKEYSANKKLSNEALTEFENYNYPGNVRELRSTLLRAFMLSGDKEKITREHLIFDGIQYKLDEIVLNTGGDTSPEMEKVANVIKRMISATKDPNIDKGKRKKLTGPQMLTSEYLPKSNYGGFDNLKKTYLKPNKEKIKTLIPLNPSLNIASLPGIKTSIR